MPCAQPSPPRGPAFPRTGPAPPRPTRPLAPLPHSPGPHASACSRPRRVVPPPLAAVRAQLPASSPSRVARPRNGNRPRSPATLLFGRAPPRSPAPLLKPTRGPPASLSTTQHHPKTLAHRPASPPLGAEPPRRRGPATLLRHNRQELRWSSVPCPGSILSSLAPVQATPSPDFDPKSTAGESLRRPIHHLR